MLPKIIILLLATICLVVPSLEKVEANEHESYQRIEELHIKPTQPVFIQDIVYLVQPGTVTALTGTASIKSKDQKRYSKLSSGSNVLYGDILGLYPDSSVTIMSEGQKLRLESGENTRWFVFKKKNKPKTITE